MDQAAPRGVAARLVLGDRLTLGDVARAAEGGATFTLAEDAWARVARGRALVDGAVASGTSIYGVTTGVGSQKDAAADPAGTAEYNRRVLRAHATRAPLPAHPARVVRAALAIQVHLYASGRAGIRPALLQALLDRLNQDDLPAVQAGASVGIGDLIEAAQMAVPLLDRVGRLAAKEGVSLLNGNAIGLARAALALVEARRLTDALARVAALSLEGFRGNADAWSGFVDGLVARPGQAAAGAALRAALAGSALLRPGAARLLQDPLCFRCVPSVHAGTEATYAFAATAIEAELNAVVENPLACWEEERFVAHAAMELTVATLAFDQLRLAIAKAVTMACERVQKVQWAAFTGLPLALAPAPDPIAGVQCLGLGHIASAAAMAARDAANPASLAYQGQVCDGVEDVGAGLPIALDGCARLLRAAWIVAGCEAACAAWAVDRRGLGAPDLGAGTGPLYAALRPLLPIGAEGEQVFDLAPLIARLGGPVAD